MTSLTGATVLNTGASGIGVADARHLAANGAATLVDVASLDAADLTYAVVNAGVAGPGPIATLSPAEWRRIRAVNLDGALLTLRAALRAMADDGAIVATAPAAGIKAEAGTAACGASKAAPIHLVKVAAREAAPRRIRVMQSRRRAPRRNTVPMFADRDARLCRARRTTPPGRYATADEVAAQIGFLLSDAAALVTGTTLIADGGYTL